MRLISTVLLFFWLSSFAVAAEIVSGQVPQGSPSIPTGQTDETTPIGAEVFGPQGGYLHPFLFLEGKYTDNLYYTNRNTQSDFITSIAPGLWLAVPPNREKLLQVNTVATSPGGLQVSRMKPQASRRMQGFLLYSPTFVFYNDNSQHDHVAHRAEGLLQYNFDVGLSVDLMNQFNNRYEINPNAAQRIDEYYDNLASLLLTFQPSEKFTVRLDFANYWIDFDDTVNDFRDRMDMAFGGYVFYQMLPKTAVFVNYEFVDIDYDNQDILDSQEQRYHLGLDWDMTAQSRGRAKAGYIRKEFDDSSLGTEEAFSAELQLQHNISPKQSVSLTGYHRFTETSIATAYTVLTTGVNFALMQRFDPKWSGTLNALYYRDDFKGDFIVGGQIRERRDDTYRIGPALIFEPRDWMAMRLNYYYSRRDSNIDVFDFENNTVSLSVEWAF